MNKVIGKTEIIQTRVPREMRKRVDERATAEGMTTSEWIRYLIRDALKKEAA